MAFDLVIRNGVVVDGSGRPGVRADVGISDGVLATIGRITDKGSDEIDAEGHVVTPGFIDGHTHMDVQVMWDPLGTCSSWHGVTSVLMGNCGFSIAPAPADRDLVIQNVKRSEDIAQEAWDAGVDWEWESFAEYMDAVDRRPHGINYAPMVGHSALRVWAMGERGFDAGSTEDAVVAMERELERALDAGAFGFSTSRTLNHMRPNGRPVASRMAEWSEVRRLVEVMQNRGGLFQLAHEDAWGSHDREEQVEYQNRFIRMIEDTGVPTTWGVVNEDPAFLASSIEVLDRAQHVPLVGQVLTKEVTLLQSFRAHMPFDILSEWAEIRGLPIEEQQRALRDPSCRERLVKAAHHGDYGRSVSNEGRAPDFDWFLLMDRSTPPNPSVASLARERGTDPVDVIIDAALDTNFDQFFIQVFGSHDLGPVVEAMKHPRTIVPFSDSGAHLSWILDAAAPTHLLGYWVRDREEFTLEQAVRMLTLEPALALGFEGRGLLREGAIADVVIFDPDRVAPAMPYVASDLPGGVTRLKQEAVGMLATVVGGEVVLRDGQYTGATPGGVLRRKRPTAR